MDAIAALARVSRATVFTSVGGKPALLRDAFRLALWIEVNEERRRGAATIVADVKARARLRTGLDQDEAADVVWVLDDPVHHHMLVIGRGWSDEKFQKWLTRALEAELLGD